MPASPSAFHLCMIVRTHLAVYPSNSATSRGVLPSFACHKICQWVRSTASVVCRYRFWSSSAVKSVCTSTLFAIPPLYTTWTDFILFKTGARVSEIIALTLDDWHSRGLKDTAWARNKGSRKRPAKNLCASLTRQAGLLLVRGP